jgi:putative glutamine amidotransferase
MSYTDDRARRDPESTDGRRPVVLLPPDIQTVDTHRGPLPQYVSQRHYADAILEAGGLPLVPPAVTDEAALDQLVRMADALVLPGGGFDIDPALYGEPMHEKCGSLKPERTNLERALLVRAEEQGIPILGVCGGMQLMNVVRGGTLWQDLGAQVGTPIGHQQPGPKHEPAHGVTVKAQTQLARLVGEGALASLPVNSTHHQAVKALGSGLVATAEATDGIVEAFEDPGRAFFVGVQWHPESMREAPHRAIYRGLIDAARARMASVT